MRGRKPTPTPILNLRGSRRAKQRPAEPKPKLATIRPPKSLTPAERDEWRRLSRELTELGVASRADRATLTVWCETWARREKAKAEILKVGPAAEVVRGATGGAEYNRWYGIIRHCDAVLLKLAAEFGLTPASRARVHVSPPAAEPDEFERLYATG